jgi:YVTN family beta-propeller protein
MKPTPLLSSLAVLVIGASSALAAADARSTLAVAIPSQETVGLYQVEGPTLTLKTAVPVGKSPGRMCLDPARATVYVVTAAGASAIDVASAKVTASFADPAIKSPYGCLVSPDARKLYVADREANTVFVFSTASREVLKRIAVPEDVRHGIYLPGNKSIVFSCAGANTLAVVDAATDTVTRTIKTIGLDPRNLIVTPDGKYLGVTLVSSDIVSWFHADTLEPMNSFGVTRSPQGMVVSPDGLRVYVTGYYEGEIAVIDMREHNHEGVGEWRQSTVIPAGPATSIAISPDSNYLYASPTGGALTVVDLRSWKIVKSEVKGAGSVLYIE